MFGILAGIFAYRADSREKVGVSVAPPSFTVTVPEVVTGNCFFGDRMLQKYLRDMYNFARMSVTF